MRPQKNWGGTSKFTFHLEGNSGNASGGNVGAGNFQLQNTHPFTTLKLIARGGSVGSNYLNIGGTSTTSPPLNVDNDIKGKSVSITIYANGSSAYSKAYFDVELS